MAQSFAAVGFAPPDCEFLFLDNAAGNRFDAYAGYNIFLRAARGAYVILCHQDVRLLSDGRDRLDAVIAELDSLDTRWGLFGNAGGLRSGNLAIRISVYDEEVTQGGPFPVACQTLDENFIVVRAAANLAASTDLHGFHLYGTDLCLVASILGYTAYIVDFHLRHESRGVIDDVFVRAAAGLVDKYARTMRPAFVTTSCTKLVITPSAFLNRTINTRAGLRFVMFAARVANGALRWIGARRPRTGPAEPPGQSRRHHGTS
ncbi:MAG: hypothetical protein P4L90_29460 [Rhodopila sp.]|nr:hypothetical protein [Rhodopila sp.]